MLAITQEEYAAKFAAYLAEKGPNPAGDQFGRMAWLIQTTRDFKAEMIKTYDLTGINTTPNIQLGLNKNASIKFTGE